MADKFYTRSNGEQILMKDVEFTHLSNGMAKKYRELFEAESKDAFSKKLQEINDIKEEIHGRINKYYDGLGDE